MIRVAPGHEAHTLNVERSVFARSLCENVVEPFTKLASVDGFDVVVRVSSAILPRVISKRADQCEERGPDHELSNRSESDPPHHAQSPSSGPQPSAKPQTEHNGINRGRHQCASNRRHQDERAIAARGIIRRSETSQLRLRLRLRCQLRRFDPRSPCQRESIAG